MPKTLLRSPYGYTPSLAATVAFTVLFSLSTLVHTGQIVHKKSWPMLVLAVGGFTEIVGWASRLYSHFHYGSNEAFQSQIVTLIIAPTFFSAANYVILGALISHFGRRYSYLSPKAYLIVFITCDVVSLVVQAIGGGMAAIASNQLKSSANGTHIMVAGIIFQLVSMTFYVIFGLNFGWKVLLDRANRKKAENNTPGQAKSSISSGIIVAMVISTIAIYIRSVYRTIELLQGWTGYIITHEPYFDCLDGAMMLICLLAFNIWHPSRYGICVPEKSKDRIANVDLPTVKVV